MVGSEQRMRKPAGESRSDITATMGMCGTDSADERPRHQDDCNGSAFRIRRLAHTVTLSRCRGIVIGVGVAAFVVTTEARGVGSPRRWTLQLQQPRQIRSLSSM